MGDRVNVPVELSSPGALKAHVDEPAHLGFRILVTLAHAQMVADVPHVVGCLELGNARRDHLRERRGERRV